FGVAGDALLVVVGGAELGFDEYHKPHTQIVISSASSRAVRGPPAFFLVRGGARRSTPSMPIETACGAALQISATPPRPVSSCYRLKLNQLTFTKSAGWPLENVR